MERSSGKQKWKRCLRNSLRFFKNTNELSISIPGKFAKPMIIEWNTFVFFGEFEILLEKIRIYHMVQFISVSLRQIMPQGTSIVKEWSRINDACLYTNNVQWMWNTYNCFTQLEKGFPISYCRNPIINSIIIYSVSNSAKSNYSN